MRVILEALGTQLRKLFLESREKGGGGTSLDDYAVSRHADLAGVDERAERDASCCGVNVRVVKNL